MGPIVAVDVAPTPAQDSAELATLLATCTEALPEGSCGHDATLPPEAEPSALARVSWSSDESSTVIEVRLEDVTAGTFTRELVFSPADDRLERWKTVGLTIATMVDELHERAAATEAPAVQEPAAPPPSEAKPEPPPPPARPAPAAPAPPPRLPPSSPPRQQPAYDTLEAGGSFATGLASGAGRGGLYARAAHDVGALPAYADIAVSYTLLARTDDPSVTWVEAALGGGVHVTASTLRLELGLAALVRSTIASARDPQTGVRDAASSWTPGAGLSTRLAWPARGPLSGTLALQGTWVMRAVTITNAGTVLGEVPAYSVGLSAGVRINWPR